MNIHIYWYISWLLDNIFYSFIGCTVIDYFHISYLFLRQKRSISCKVQFLTTYTISASEFEPRSWQGALDTTLCEKVCQWLAADQWFSCVLRFPPPINLATTNNWNIIESGIKHHNPIPTWFQGKSSLFMQSSMKIADILPIINTSYYCCSNKFSSYYRIIQFFFHKVKIPKILWKLY